MFEAHALSLRTQAAAAAAVARSARDCSTGNDIEG